MHITAVTAIVISLVAMSNAECAPCGELFMFSGCAAGKYDLGVCPPNTRCLITTSGDVNCGSYNLGVSPRHYLPRRTMSNVLFS